MDNCAASVSPGLDSNLGNELLLSLPASDRKVLKDHLENVPLKRSSVIEAPAQPIDYVYFPDTGLVSVQLSDNRRGAVVEIGMVGRDGMTGLAMVLGDGNPVTKTIVQIGGMARRIKATILQSELEKRPTLYRHFARYAHALALQTSYTAFANGRGRIQERLARWLLMCLDRQDEATIRITQEFIADALGSRRAGVTEALGALTDEGVIKNARGAITVLDRSMLTKVAGSFYGVAEGEQKRLISQDTTTPTNLGWG
jgi:CRP-like cAMP-binding protein